MRYLNKGAFAALAMTGLIAGAAAAAQQKPVGVPSVAPVGDATPPANLPAGSGPSATSGAERFDEVGYAAVAGAGAGGITVSGARLPAGGFAEVTDLATGRTALLETRATPAATRGVLAELSPKAAKLIGMTGTAAVRIRQVDPIAADQVALSQGRPAAPRLDAPPILLNGLRARVADVAAPATARPAPPVAAVKPGPATSKPVPATPKPGTSYAPPSKPAAPVKASAPGPVKPAKATAERAAAKPPAKPAPATGKYRVRVGTFSNEGNAKGLAARFGGHVSQSGKFWLVELGPFADAAAAKSARDGAAKRGYGDARVITD